MKRRFFRKKRITSPDMQPLNLKVEKKITKGFSGILQTVINVLIYAAIFLFLYKNNVQRMGMFIAFMAASAIAQVIIRFAQAISFNQKFPFIHIKTNGKKYKEYLKSVTKQIDDYVEKYESWLNKNLFSTDKQKDIIKELSHELFQRLPNHSDFLTLNLGVANIHYPITIMYPTLTYSEKDKILEKFETETAKKLLSKEKLPYSFSLLKNKSLSFENRGIQESVFISIINAMVLDLAALQSAEELVLGFVFDSSIELDWVRFLPHVWHNDRRMIYCGTEPENEFAKMLNTLIEDKSKHCVFFVDSDYAQSTHLFNTFNNESLPENLSVVFFSLEGNTPSRCEAAIPCWDNQGVLSGTLEDTIIALNCIESSECSDIARQLMNINLIDSRNENAMSIPFRLTFFELFGMKTPRQMPLATPVENKNIHLTFPVKIGLGENSEPISIDITNDGDGNHCLITGTTGSGKSEFMLTFVLTACAIYQPDYLSFVIIDFKGGSMSSKVRDLPHCLGEFTNSGNDVGKREVTRIAEMLEYEIARRLAILEANGCADDLARYHELYYEGKVETPLPRLLIVVDEVAVFFSKDTKASNYITHIATVGRSVGMILVLATQSKSGVIPSQVRTNININIEFYSEDDIKQGRDRIKGRAIINSNLKSQCHCQVALSSVYTSNTSSIDFLTLSAKSRLYSGQSRKSQFEQITTMITEERFSDTEAIDEVLTLPLEAVIERAEELKSKEALPLSVLQNLFYDEEQISTTVFPIGLADNIYCHKRQIVCYSTNQYNLLIYGKAQSGKTLTIQSIVTALCNQAHGIKPNKLSIYIVAKNVEDYKCYFFPQIGSILSENNLYYLLLFLSNEIEKRSQNGNKNDYLPIIAIIDDCYFSIQQNKSLSEMLNYITNECVKYNICVIMSLTHKSSFGNSALRHFSETIALNMGDDFDYSTLMHMSSIKQIPDRKGHCLATIADMGSSKTLEVQIARPYDVDEAEILRMAERYSKLWVGKPKTAPIPLMPEKVIASQNTETRIQVGLTVDLMKIYWDVSISNTYLVSYLNEQDAIRFVRYLAKAFHKLGYQVFVVDNNRYAISKSTLPSSITYYRYDEQDELLASLNGNLSERTALVMLDYVRCLFPSSGEKKELVQKINDLAHKNEIKGVFAEHKEFINSARYSSPTTKFGSYLEGANSGMLIGNTPGSHTFGYGQLSAQAQQKPLDIGWGVNVSPVVSDIRKTKLVTEVD